MFVAFPVSRQVLSRFCSFIKCLVFLIDPPTEVKINTSNGLEIIHLTKDFGKYVLTISAEPYSAISCSSVNITWVSPTKGNLLSCQSEGDENLIVFNSCVAVLTCHSISAHLLIL